MPSAALSRRRWATTTGAGTRRKWYSWQRDRMVAGTASISVVAKMKTRPRRWLLDDLEQRVEGLARQAMDLVEHHHLVAVARRSVAQALGQLAHLLDLRVGGRVHLEHVEVGAGGDLAAGGALVAGLGGRAALAVERLGQEPRGGRLADSADAGEEVGLGDPPLGQGVAQRGDDRLLADQVGEALGPPLAGQDLIGHGCPPTPPLSPARGKGALRPTLICRRFHPRRRPVKGSGGSAAPGGVALSLLPSGPDEVRRPPMHRTRTLHPPPPAGNRIRRRG